MHDWSSRFEVMAIFPETGGGFLERPLLLGPSISTLFLFFFHCGDHTVKFLTFETATFFLRSYFDNAVNDSTSLNMRGARK